MRKILSGIIICFAIMASNAYSQSNLTWTINGNLPKGFFKTATVINSTFTGFKSKAEIATFCQNLKAFTGVAACEISSSTATSCNVKLTLKQPQSKSYYLGLASKNGVSYISIRGTKKSLDELRQGKK